jgi:hypothetical protein
MKRVQNLKDVNSFSEFGVHSSVAFSSVDQCISKDILAKLFLTSNKMSYAHINTKRQFMSRSDVGIVSEKISCSGQR